MIEMIDLWWKAWWAKTTAFVTLAAMAGGLGYVTRVLDNDERVRAGRTVIEVMSAAFVGLLFKLVCDEVGLSDRWTGVVVGLAGWLGASASVRMLENLVYDKLGLKEKPTRD